MIVLPENIANHLSDQEWWEQQAAEVPLATGKTSGDNEQMSTDVDRHGGTLT